IGSEVFIFMAPHPLQVFHWVDLDVALIILGLAGTAAITITLWLPRLAAHQNRGSHKMLFSIWLWIIGVSLAGAFLGNLYGSWGERRFTRAGILYSRNRDNNSGPLSYLVTDLTKRLTKITARLSLDRTLQIAQRPIVSMHEYT